MRKKATVLAMASVLLLLSMGAYAEVKFEVMAKWRYSNVTKRGKFFTSPEEEGLSMPQSRSPWVSDGNSTIFGITFPEQIKLGKGVGLVKINKITIFWGQHVPAPDTWGGILVTRSKEIIRLPIDSRKKLYPHDRTIIKIKPVDAETFCFAVKGKDRGLTDNFVSLRGIEVRAGKSVEKLVTNKLSVYAHGAYSAAYSTANPGEIFKIVPVSPYFRYGAYPAWVKTAAYGSGYGIFEEITPFLLYQGKRLMALKKPYPVKAETSHGEDKLYYDLSYQIPNQKEPVTLSIEALFSKKEQDCIVLKMKAGENFPPEAKIGLVMKSPAELFQKYYKKESPAELSRKGEFDFDTPAGKIGIKLTGAESLSAKNEGEFTSFSTKSVGKTLTVAFSLPFGAEARARRPDAVTYQAPAGSGDEGYKPFKKEDLELLEVINCGDAK